MTIKEVYEKNFERDTYEPNINFIKKKSNAKTYRGYLQGCLQKARNDYKNDSCSINTVLLIEDLIKTFNKFYPSVRVNIKGWKGKSGIVKITRGLGGFNIVRMRKENQDECVKEIGSEILFDDMNLVLKALYSSRGEENAVGKISTRYIAENFCKLSGMDINGHNRQLFEGDEFIWDNFFSDRKLHQFLNDCLGTLDYFKVILYRGKFSEILKDDVIAQKLGFEKTP